MGSLLLSRDSLFVCFQKNGFDVVDDKLVIEEAGAVDVTDVLIGIKKVHFEDVAKEAAPITVFLPEFSNRLVKICEKRLKVGLCSSSKKMPIRAGIQNIAGLGEMRRRVTFRIKANRQEGYVFC